MGRNITMYEVLDTDLQVAPGSLNSQLAIGMHIYSIDDFADTKAMQFLTFLGLNQTATNNLQTTHFGR